MNKIQNIPDGWEVKKLGDVCSTFSGGTPSIDCVEYYNGDIPFIRSGEIHSDKTKIFLTTAGLASSSAKKIEVGDLLYALYGANSGDVDISQIGGAINQAILCIRSHKMSTLYLKSLLENEKQNILNKYLQGGQGNLSAEIIKSLKLLIPSLSEQERIARVLGYWDEGIEELGKIISLKEQQKKGLMQRLLTGKTRLPGFTQPWKEVKLGDILQQVSKRNRLLETKQVLSVTNNRGFILPEEQFSRTVASEDLSNYKIVTKGEFAYNPSRLNVGSIDRLDNFPIGALSPMYIIFKCNQEILSDYMKHWIRTSEFNSKVRNSAQGSVRETVDFKTLSSIKTHITIDIKEQSAIAAVLSEADNEINQLKQKLALFKQQKKWLMQQLLTGKKRLKIEKEN